jgi:hypothetical protein
VLSIKFFNQVKFRHGFANLNASADASSNGVKNESIFAFRRANGNATASSNGSRSGVEAAAVRVPKEQG